MKKTTVLLVSVFVFAGFLFGDVIKLVDFETSGGYSTSITEFTNGSDDYFIRTNESTTSGSVTNIQGSYYFGAQDIDGEGATLPVTLSIDDIDISGYTNLEFKVYLAEDDDGSNQYWDAADYVHFDYDIDNSGSFTNLLHVESVLESGINGEPKIDTDFDGVGDSTEITSVFTKFVGNIDTIGTTIDIKITFYLNAGDEDIAIDEILITGDYTAVVENPSDFSVKNSSPTQIDLSWNKNADNDSVMIAWNSTNTFGTPIDSSSYLVGNSIVGGGTILYIGIDSSYSHTSLDTETKYYYKIWSVDISNNYSPGITDEITTLTDEPSNHVTNFSVIKAGYSKIDLSWTENDGTQAADGYLIVMSNTYNMITPTDGSEIADNDSIGSECGIKNISYGVTNYEWTGLNAETDYYAKIYPYTNSGSEINYKTDGDIPTGNDTTGVEPDSPTIGDLYITEVCGDSIDGTNNDNGFMEIYNNSDHAISLRDVEARYYNSNPGNPSQTVVLNEQIDSGDYIIVTQNETNFNNEYSVIADFFGSNFYFNGGDDGCDIYYPSVGILDCFNDNGNSTSPWNWNDDYTYERNSINSGADSINWTEITSGTATPGTDNNTHLVNVTPENNSNIVNNYKLGNTYPNPFNPTFTIPLQLNENAFVNIELINIVGQKVKNIKNTIMNTGKYNLQVNCENLTSGIYFVKVRIDNVNEIQKVILLK